ncbi:thioredoxin domain-containing protein 12-like isoform X2 [Lycorma delicatula]|uniref:thioredoxin domain-containing protein 12-like isoform X2 n=1 Tax=Lycorma delicatula TaxID=130591 RepID=UPI003F513705
MWIKPEIISVGLVYISSYLLCKVKAASNNSGLDRGFGREISWRFFEMGLAEAKSQNLPIMMIFHKSWCSACKALKPQVAASTEIRDLSKQFIMINVADDEEPHDAKYAPDGAYIPRILFLQLCYIQIAVQKIIPTHQLLSQLYYFILSVFLLRNRDFQGLIDA